MRRSGHLLRKVVVIALLLGLLGTGAWGLWQWRGGSDKAVRYRTEKVQRGRVASLINASGTVVPKEVVDVGAQVAGKVVDFGKDPNDSRKVIDYGTEVKKGTVLAVIDKSLYKADWDVSSADVSSAKADINTAAADVEVAKADVEKCKADLKSAGAMLELATRDYERAQMSKFGSITPAEVDQKKQAFSAAKAGVPASEAALEKAKKTVVRAEAAKERAKAALEKAEASEKRARTNYDYCDIISPVKGVVIDRRVNIGQTVVSSLNAPSLFLIAADLKEMQVWASVNEADVGRIRPGQTTLFKVDAYPDETFTGIVDQIRLNAMQTNNVVTYTVVVNTDNSNLKLLPYLTANLQFHVEHRDDVLTVPNGALRYRPALDRIDPEFRAWYLESRKRRTTTQEMKQGKAAESRGVVWLQGSDGFLSPVRVVLGLTDGTTTEVLKVIDGELDENADVIVGEAQATSGGGGENPFAVKMWGAKKKE
jgi:HlyD family secretion protein